MTILSVHTSFLVVIVIAKFACFCHFVLASHDSVIGTERQALEIIIGGGGGAPPPESVDCPPPPPPEPVCPPPPPPPSPFPSKRIARAYRIIQDFRKQLLRKEKYDPKGIAKSWDNKDVCSYKGFACSKRPDVKELAVAAVDFNGFAFGAGEVDISEFLGEMIDLAIFHANSNNFTGSTPKDISPDVIKYFYELDLSNNKYVGQFPYSVLKATNLTFLDVRFNRYYGSVPAEVFNLDLDVLFINNNNFTGCLPDNLGSSPVLYLTFANNQFTGPIPPSIGKCKNLREVLFLNNHFSGCLPYEVGFLKNLSVFDVGTNDLHGPIPYSFSCLKKLEILNLAHNEFYGPVPEIICDLPKVENLSLSYNYFTEVGPKCTNLIHRKRLDIKMNCILGLPNQRSPEECKSFFAMHKTCPNEKSLTYIPCETHTGYEDSRQTAPHSTAPAPSPRSYEALKPHRLRL